MAAASQVLALGIVPCPGDTDGAADGTIADPGGLANPVPRAAQVTLLRMGIPRMHVNSSITCGAQANVMRNASLV